jgi:HAMP domain-containing protein
MTTPVKEQSTVPPPSDRVVHLSPRADEIETGSKAFRRVTSIDRFPQLISLLSLASLAVVLYFLGVRFTDALDRNTVALAKLTDAVVQHEIAATMREQVARERR